jgi:signal peptidase I
MHAYLSLLLTVAVFACGALALIDIFILAPRRKAAIAKYQSIVTTQDAGALEKLRHTPAVFKLGKAYFPVLAIVFLIRSFVAEPNVIPSGSMIPTLEIGDFILVNKFAYGIRLPVINKKVIPIGDPQRGDVMVFRFPSDPSVNYIKRVIGLPGDRIRYTSDKHLFVNDQLITDDLISTYSDSIMGKIDVFKEKIGNAEHLIHKSMRATPAGEWAVPEGHYFMMGDNRDNSNDSRFWDDPSIPKEILGMVPDKNIVGKASLVLFNWPNPKLSHLPTLSSAGLIK